jgi:hypothetical protein
MPLLVRESEHRRRIQAARKQHYRACHAMPPPC